MKKQNCLLLVLMAMFVMGFVSCNTQRANAKTVTYDNDAQTRTYELGSFDKIDMSGVSTIHFVQGANQSVKAQSTSGHLDRLKLEVKDGHLYVKIVGEGSVRVSEDYDIYITAPKLTALKVSGVGTFQAQSLETKHFELKVSGVSNFKVGQLKCDDTRIVVSGVGNVSTSVMGDNLYIQSSGVSNNDIKFKGKVADIHNSGVGNTTVDLDCDELTAQNSGQSTLKLKGHADKTNINNSGLSSIDTSNLNQY